MIGFRRLAVPIGVAAALSLSACFAPLPRTVPPPRVPAPVPLPPVPVETVPDAVPRVEPRSHNGNPPFYDVFGKRYYVLALGAGYVERGVASWYGPGFHAERTSTGEPYDMYGMTAAHKTLPLPAYVRVTNLQNGRSIVVRVNDRGPFVGNRIIDLSYTAAAKLDMLRNGTAMVEVRDIEPGLAAAPTPMAATLAPATSSTITPPSAPALFVQAGAFADAHNAERLAAKLRGNGFGEVRVNGAEVTGRHLYRVRIGPVPDVAEFDRIVAALEHAGVDNAHLALD